MTVKRQILESASAIALVTVISRICGYLRDQRVALLLGTSPAADSFVSLALRAGLTLLRGEKGGINAGPPTAGLSGGILSGPRRSIALCDAATRSPKAE